MFLNALQYAVLLKLLRFGGGEEGGGLGGLHLMSHSLKHALLCLVNDCGDVKK